MKFVFLCATLLLGLGQFSLRADPALETGWQNPPTDARLRAYWWWLNGNVTKASITRDLEQMKAKGFGGAVLIDANGADQWGNAPVPHGPTFFSPAWRELYKHALHEAGRLGLEISLNIQSGWNLGGPSNVVSQADAAKKYVWSELKVTGGTNLTVQLPQPQARDHFYRDFAVVAYRLKSAPANRGNQLAFTASSSQPDYPARLAADDDANTFWVSAGTQAGEGPTREKPEWLQITLDKPAAVSELKIQGRPGHGPRECELQVSDDGKTFRAVKDFPMSDGVETSVNFAPVTGADFRVLFFSAFDSGQPRAPRNVQVAELKLNLPGSTTVRRQPLENWRQKALQKSLEPFSAPDSSPLFAEFPATPGEQDTDTTNVLDLTKNLSPDGVLKWDAPAGEWQIFRFGYTIGDNAYVSTASDGWNGYAIDVYSATAFEHYWNQIVEPLIADAGPLAGKTLKYLHTDSWEIELANWTPNLRAEFQKRHGYDLLSWLPVLAGRIVNSREQSDRFLFDYRKTLGDLAIDDHYKLFRDNAHKHGIGIHPESGGPHAVPIDAQRCLGWDDAPMSEFWAWSWEHRIGDANRFFVKQPASAAHTYGHKYVFAEGFTTIGPNWQEKIWSNLKPSFDKALCEGMNELVWHAFVCSPDSTGIPGQQYFAGTHLNPKVTWWNESAPFFSYIDRSQFLLQQGLFHADVLYYYGDHVPNFTQYKATDPAHCEPGYDYDVITAEALIERASVRDGKIVLPDGMSYRLLVIPDRDQISLAVLEKIKALVEAGATVIGPKPLHAETLENFAAADAQVKTIADELWGGSVCDEEGQTNFVGHGRVIIGKTAREVLLADGVPPDFEWSARQPTGGADGGDSGQVWSRPGAPLDIDYIHRTAGDAEIYFVANRTNYSGGITAAFRVTGKAPELWNAVTGEHHFAAAYEEKDGRTCVPLDFGPCGSWFVIFREPASAHPATAQSNGEVFKPLRQITGAWTVHFDPKWGGPASVPFDSLVDWTTRPEAGVKFYSGTAVYEKTFDLPASAIGHRPSAIYLDLGNLHELAEVKVNGRDCGITWCPPFRVDVTDAVKSGANQLAVKVVNFWPNRLIGDASLPPAQRFTQTNIRAFTPKTPLEPAGLLGPVELLSGSPAQ